MVLLDQSVHILALPKATPFRQQLFALQITDGANVSGVLTNVDHPWGGEIRSAQDFAEATLSRSSTAGLIQESDQGWSASLLLVMGHGLMDDLLEVGSPEINEFRDSRKTAFGEQSI